MSAEYNTPDFRFLTGMYAAADPYLQAAAVAPATAATGAGAEAAMVARMAHLALRDAIPQTAAAVKAAAAGTASTPASQDTDKVFVESFCHITSLLQAREVVLITMQYANTCEQVAQRLGGNMRARSKEADTLFQQVGSENISLELHDLSWKAGDLSSILHNLPKLNKLVLKRCTFNLPHLEALAQNPHAQTGLQELTIEDPQMQDGQVFLNISKLRALTNVRVLHLTKLNVDAARADWDSNNRGLDTHVYNTRADFVFRELVQLSQIRVLKLSFQSSTYISQEVTDGSTYVAHLLLLLERMSLLTLDIFDTFASNCWTSHLLTDHPGSLANWHQPQPADDETTPPLQVLRVQCPNKSAFALQKGMRAWGGRWANVTVLNH